MRIVWGGGGSVRIVWGGGGGVRIVCGESGGVRVVWGGGGVVRIVWGGGLMYGRLSEVKGGDIEVGIMSTWLVCGRVSCVGVG